MTARAPGPKLSIASRRRTPRRSGTPDTCDSHSAAIRRPIPPPAPRSSTCGMAVSAWMAARVLGLGGRRDVEALPPEDPDLAVRHVRGSLAGPSPFRVPQRLLLQPL